MLTRTIKARGATAAMFACCTALNFAAFAAAATAATTRSAHKTVALLQGQTKTINVAYPQALKHSGARYSCTASVSGPARSQVKILSRGSRWAARSAA